MYYQPPRVKYLSYIGKYNTDKYSKQALMLFFLDNRVSITWCHYKK